MTDLASVIKAIESGGNPRALRFEPGVYAWDVSVYDREATVRKIGLLHRCSMATAHILFSTSFGQYQEMGFNLWDASRPLISADEFTFRSDTALQDKAFADFLAARGIAYELADMLADPAKLEHFVEVWNGPGNVDDYAALIRQHAAAGS